MGYRRRSFVRLRVGRRGISCDVLGNRWIGDVSSMIMDMRHELYDECWIWSAERDCVGCE